MTSDSFFHVAYCFGGMSERYENLLHPKDTKTFLDLKIRKPFGSKRYEHIIRSQSPPAATTFSSPTLGRRRRRHKDSNKQHEAMTISSLVSFIVILMAWLPVVHSTRAHQDLTAPPPAQFWGLKSKTALVTGGTKGIGANQY